MILRRINLFNTSSSGNRLFQQPYAQAGGNPPTGSSGEIDLRQELDELFFGYKSGIRHAHQALIRRLRRDSAGKALPCECRDAFTREPDPDCSYCLGEGYLWDEGWVWTYSTYGGSDSGLTNRINYNPPGNVRVDFKVFYLRYDGNIRYGDKIVEMKLDEAGKLVVPYVRETIYQPQTIAKMRSDNGRIEYITVYCRESDALRLDHPNE